MCELPPPPAPRPVSMPAMSDADKQRLGISSAAAPAAGAPMMGAPMMSPPMIGSPMMGMPMVGGCPSVGMGPNLVFNFGGGGYPGMCMVAPAPPAAEPEPEKPAKPPGPPQLVQGNPTWCRPRMPVKKGQKMKDDPCVIM